MSAKVLPKIGYVLKTIAKYLALFIFSIYVLIWGLSPFAARHFLGDFLTTQGITLSDASQIRYNPFFTVVTIKDFSYSKNGATPLQVKQAEVEIDLHQLLFNKIYVKTFHFDGIDLSVSSGQDILDVAGFELPQSPEQEEKAPETSSAEFPYTVLSPSLTVENVTIDLNYQGQKFPLEIELLSLEKVVATQAKQSLNLRLIAKIAEGKVTLDSRADVEGQNIALTSTLDIDSIQLGAFKHFTQDILDELNAQFSTHLSLKTEISGKNIQAQLDDSYIALRNLNVKKDLYAAKFSEKEFKLNMLKASLVDSALTKLDSNTSFTLKGLDVGNTKTNDQLLAWTELALSEISISATGITEEDIKLGVSEVLLSGLSASKVYSEANDYPALALIEQIKVSDIQFAEKQLSIDEINVQSLNGNMSIDADKNPVSLAAFSDEAETKPQADETSEETSSASTEEDMPEQAKEQSLAIRLNKFFVSGDNQFYFRDDSVAPAYERTFFIDTFELLKLDNQSEELSPIRLIGRSNEYSKIDIEGGIAPFTEKVNLKLAGKIQEVSLPAVSSYIKESLGFELKSGQLDTDLDVAVEQSQLAGDIKLFLRGLDMSAANDAQANSLKDQSAVPLNVALGMLKDKKGNIKLKVPMKGSVDDPSFGVSSFLMLVTKKALMSQAKSYLMKTFVPYANVISVAVAAGEFALKLRFEDLPFSPANSEIGDQQTQYMQQFIALMKDKEKTQVKVCPLATPADIGLTPGTKVEDPTQIENMKAFAKLRGEAFKKYAVEQGGIASSRMLLCSPEADFGKDAQPRIKISI